LPGRAPQSVGVPAKGDSASSNPPLGPADGATISDAPSTPPPSPAKPSTQLPHADATLLDDLSSRSGIGRPVSGIYINETVLNPGDVLGGRYEILQLLGEGGMGAVYKALDREVDRTVALKLIRPALASNPRILARFKQELLTAHQVTHKNVIRIYDIAEADGVKFITMEYVEGSDLRHILIENGKLAPERVIEIIRQVCIALEAAHTAGVIHRDLKPQNIMQESKTGRILVMDFGLARSLESDGMTQTGALLGTIEYMSPEQSMGKPLDQRSDIFAVGLIFCEMLTGKTPYKADTAMASLLRRNQERATPAAELDATVPKGLSDIVAKCLERDLENRYQNVQEILQDLDAFQGARPTLASMAGIAVAPPKSALPWKWIGIGSLVLVMLAGGWILKTGLVRSGSSNSSAGSVKAPELSLAILPFRNASGDNSLDWLGPTLADMLSTGVGQSAQMRVISPERLHQVLSDLRITQESPMDATMVGHIAESSSANAVFWGKYVRYNDKIRIDGTLQDLKHDRRYPITVDAPAEKDLSGTVSQIAEQIRQSLSVSAAAMKELKASSFQPSSKSTLALRDYTQGVRFLHDGRDLDAVQVLNAAVKEDPSFALAYSRLAEANSALGYDADAEKYSRKAIDLSQNLAPQERYRIEAIHARMMKDYPKAISSYQNLVAASPGDTDLQLTLGLLYEDTGAYQKAREQYAAVLKADPQSVEVLWKMGGVEIMSDNPQGSLDYLNRGLTLSIQQGNEEKKARILQATGIAYRLMNKPEEAMRNYQEALPIERRIGDKRGVAASLNEMAQVYALLGKGDAALASFNEAMQVRREIGAKKEIGDTLMDLGNFYEERGQHEQALKMLAESLQIQRDSDDKTYQAVLLNSIGSVYLSSGQYDNALTYFQQALQLREELKVPGEIVESVYNLGETNAKLGQYDEALKQYLRALDLYRGGGDKRGSAIDSYSMGSLFSRQARYGAALSSEEEALKTFKELNDRSSMMADILSGYGRTLAEAGREQEAQKILDEALNLARELKSQPLVAQTLNFQGDAALYRGDFKSAGTLYAQALQVASRTKDRDKVLEAKIGLAKVASKEGHTRQAISSFKSLAQEADSLGMKDLSVECSVGLAEAFVNAKDYSRARQELEPALSKAEKLGLKALLAKAHYLLATVLRETGNGGEAKVQYAAAVRLLDEIRKEAGAEKVIERADLKPIYEQSSRWSQGDKNNT
jgi:eukaryotic-like serine/threonine-protein kinase